MSEDVIVKISGERIQEDETESLEYIMPGKYTYEDGAHKIYYDEILEDMSGKVENNIYINDYRLEIIKTGIVNSKMIFDMKENSNMLYETPYGEIDMQIITKSYRFKEDDELIRVCVEYSMYSGGDLVSDSNIIIDIYSKTGNENRFNI